MAGRQSSNPISQGQTIPLMVAMGWGLGSLGMSTLFQAFSVLLLRYLTDYLGIAAVVAGFMIGGSKIFDALIDPAIGALSDRTRSRWGRRRPYLLIGGAACVVSFVLMFNVPPLQNKTLRIVLVEVVLLAFAAGYGLFNIPYLAMPPEMSTSPRARTTLISFRVAGVGVGSLLASFVGPLLITFGGGGVAGHKLMAWGVAAVVLASSLGCFFLTGRARFTARGEAKRHSFARHFKLAMQNKPFKTLVCVKLISLLGQGMTFAVTPYLFIEVLKSNYAVMGQYFLVYFVALLATLPLWVKLCHRFGKKAAYLAVTPFVMLITLSWLWAGPGEPLAWIMIRAALLGGFGGSTLLIIQGMLPDTIHYDFIRTGLRREGVFAGVYTTIEKLASAAAAGLVGVILGAFGYVASAGLKVHQPASAIQAVYLLSAIPAATLGISALLLLFYHLPENMLAEAGDTEEGGDLPITA